jgi:hypothetical protein
MDLPKLFTTYGRLYGCPSLMGVTMGPYLPAIAACLIFTQAACGVNQKEKSASSESDSQSNLEENSNPTPADQQVNETEKTTLNAESARDHAAVIYDFILTLINSNHEVKDAIGTHNIIDIKCNSGTARVSLISENLFDNSGLFELEHCQVSSDEMTGEIHGTLAANFLTTGYPEIYAEKIDYRGRTTGSSSSGKEVAGSCAISLQPFAISSKGNVCEFTLDQGAADTSKGRTFAYLSERIRSRALKTGREFPSLLNGDSYGSFIGSCENGTKSEWLFESSKEAQLITYHYSVPDCSGPAAWLERVLYRIAIRDQIGKKIALELVSDRRNFEKFVDSASFNVGEDECSLSGHISYCARRPIREFRLFGPDPVQSSLEMGPPGSTEANRPEGPAVKFSRAGI